MAGALVFAASFVIYAVTAAPGLTWLDSPEFVAAAAGLGVPHSPGHPLVAILGRAATLLPLGDLAFRVNLLSAAAMAGANLALFRALRDLGREAMAEPSPGKVELSANAVAAAVTAAVGLSAAAWMQATRAEVYAIEVALLALATAAAIRYCQCARRNTPGATPALQASLWIGLALATHHFIALTVALPLIVSMVVARAPSRRVLGWSIGAGLVGLLVIVYLPIRAARNPLLNWGDPETLGRLWWTLSGSAFTGSVGAEHVSSGGTDALQIVAALLTGNPLLPLLALLGLYLSVRLDRARGAALAASAIIALTIAGRAILGFDPETPDHHAYLLPALGALAALATIAVIVLSDVVPGARRQVGVLGAVSILALTAMGVPASAERSSLAGAHAADEVARLDIDSIPPRAVALSSYFQTSFRLTALRVAEGARPDVAFIDRSFLSYPGGTETAMRRYPDLAPLIRAGVGPNAPPPREALDVLAVDRPIAIELHFNLHPSYHQLLTAGGLFRRYQPKAPSLEAQTGYRERLVALRHDSRGVDRVWLTMHLLWFDYVSLIHRCARGEHVEAARVARHALELAPGDSLLLKTARACGVKLEPTQPP